MNVWWSTEANEIKHIQGFTNKLMAQVIFLLISQ